MTYPAPVMQPSVSSARCCPCGAWPTRGEIGRSVEDADVALRQARCGLLPPPAIARHAVALALAVGVALDGGELAAGERLVVGDDADVREVEHREVARA